MNDQPVKHKSFPSPAALAKWRNSQPPGTVFLDTTTHEGKQVQYFRPPANLAADQKDVLLSKIKEHIALDARAKSAMGYHPLTTTKPVARFSLVKNAVRNLKVFEGLTPVQIDTRIREIIEEDDTGLVLLSSSDAKLLFSVRSELVIEDLQEKGENE